MLGGFMKIGILAGMGPRSTSPFLELVLDECQKQYGAKHDIDYPYMVINSLPTPFYMDREIDEEDLKTSIVNGLKYLLSSDVALVAIPCNTAHKYYDALKEIGGSKVMSIIDETGSQIPKNTKVTLLATETTRASNLYQDKIRELGSQYYFEASWQKQINEIIIMIKSKETEKSINSKWIELIGQLEDVNIKTAIIGCTELSRLIEIDHRINFVDSSKALAESFVRKYIKLKKEASHLDQ